jgi:DNA-binding Xre family transcriptional regulator
MYLASMLEVQEMAVRFRLKELLEERTPPMNQSELARQSGVSIVTINAIANNRTRQVQLDTLDAIAGVLGVEPGELLSREGKRRRGK